MRPASAGDFGRPGERQPATRGLAASDVSPVNTRLAWLCLILALPLYVTGLGWPLFWSDEATTAILARHVIERGVPYVGRGTDSASQAGDDMRAVGDVDVHSSWLQYYVGAAALAAAGAQRPVDSLAGAERVTFAGRLPFALIGFGTSVLLAWALRDALRHGPNSRPGETGRQSWADRVAVAALALSVASPAMVLHARQFRYYAPTAFAAVLVLHGYLGLYRGGRGRPALLAAASVLLALANDLTWIAVHAALGVHFLLFERQRVDLRRVAVPLLPAFATLTGWFALASTADRYGRVAFDHVARGGLVYLAEVNAHMVPWVVWLVALPAALACRRMRAGRRMVEQTVPEAEAARGRIEDGMRVGALLVLIVLALIAAHAPVRNLYFRYLLPGVPASAGLVALLLVPPVRVHPVSRAVALACLALMITTEIPGFVSDRLLPGRSASSYLTRMHERWRRPRTAVDLFASFRDRRAGPLSETLRVLWSSARPDDLVVVTYGDQTLRFYSRFTVLGGYGGEPLAEDLQPDWIWLRSNSPARSGRADVRAWVRSHVDFRSYDTIELPVPDRSFEVREDPHEYWYLREGAWPPVKLLHRRR